MRIELEDLAGLGACLRKIDSSQGPAGTAAGTGSGKTNNGKPFQGRTGLRILC
jgi:hypothetical protein